MHTMTAEQRFSRILELLPDGATITLTRADLQAILAGSAAETASTPEFHRSDWLTPEQVARAIGRSPSRVRDLRKDGHFCNAEWNGKEYMTPPSDVEKYLKWRSKAYEPPKRKPCPGPGEDQQAAGTASSAPNAGGTTPLVQAEDVVDLSGWENALPEVEHRPERRLRRDR